MLLTSRGWAQGTATSKALPRAMPHQLGLAESHIIDFLDSMAVEGHELHSLMILRRGQVIAEGWAEPYGPQINHSMFCGN